MTLTIFGKRCLRVVMVALGLTLASASVLSETVELSEDTQACLDCHDKETKKKTLGSGELLSLHVSAKAFTESMHKETDCEDCHSDIDGKTHGKVAVDIKSKRDYALGMQNSCLTCHKKKVSEYDDSVHAAMVKEGSQKAPLCSDCHQPHTVLSSKIAEPIAATPCAKCHEDIFKAYAQDVHGIAHAAKGKSAPICADCHQTHNVKAASMGTGVKDSCISCHKDSVKQHQDWLPNTERHFSAISCPACHAPDAKRRVNLRMYDSATKLQVSEKSGVPLFDKRTEAADVNNEGLNERALWSLLKEFNQDGDDSKTVLQGRLEVSSGVEAHQISEKSKAIKECNTCHKKGAEPFQSVTLTIAGPDGRPLRHGVQKDVLNSIMSVDSVRGFYVIGSTRIKLLDILLVLVVLGAMSVPIAHMSVKRLFKNMREKLEAERAAAQAEANRQAAASEANAPEDNTK
ncbi:multiheme c-type cytochrome [Rhodoferax sp.]|uniref:multiheme c-type cytochrome n=1 Tax=Rhodoferax sp. TaxID=50421 RepID=UPI0027374C6F|nr:multiheme c-type cytochrome [Rhodoferax sp.]MDP3192996.1 multiheme c-type cytochrome [Rhodoferax sp.]MDP3335356.1 multiheme c-type cytochrome [Rhodoferax sp.]